MAVNQKLKNRLEQLTTATLHTVMLKKGVRNTYIRGSKPWQAGQPRVVGEAFTLRFVPMREDLATPESWTKPVSTRHAIEAMPEGCFAVADAMGIVDAGIFGDILLARMKVRGVAGLLTDGVLRDSEGCSKVDLPVWCQGQAAPASIAALTFVGWNETVACGGCAVVPGDVIVADTDGAIVIPAGMAEEVAETAEEQERQEGWLLSEVLSGAKLPGLYPPDEATKARYEAWKQSQTDNPKR
jgi:regulator of RNase E activity RraA